MEKKFKLFKIPTVNRQSTDGQSLRQYSVSTRLFRLAALFTLLFTIGVGQMWAVETIPAGTIVYVDVTNFSGTSYDDSYYMSVTDGDGYNLDRVADKSNTAGVADYWPAGDKEWQELHQVSGNLYAGKVENEQSGGKLSFWSKDESTYNNAYEVNASLAREWSSTNRKFVFQSGSTWYDKKDDYNQRHVSCFTSSTSSIEVFTGGQVLYVKVDNWTSDNPNFEACFLGYDGQTWVSCEHVDGNYYSATVPEGEWPYVIFVRMDPSKAAHSWDSKWTQTADIAPSGTKNCVFITSSAGAYSFDKYAPSPVLTGDFNNWSPDANPFNANGIATAELPANSVCEIKVFSGTTWYGLNGTNVYGQEDTYTLNGTGASIKLHTTAVDGTYKFTWNASNNKLSIEYPDVPHPNAGYLYFLNDQGWDPVAVHVWGGKYGTTWGSNPAVSSFNWDGTDYYYVAMGDHTGAIFGQGIDNDHKTDDLTKDEEGSLGKFYKKSDTKGWYDFTATLTLKTNQGETTNPSPTSVTVTYGKPTHINEDVITTTSPAKTGYTFGGYYTAAGGSGTQVINTSEKIPSNLSGYTTDGIWTKTGSSVSADLYAKWTQSVPLDKENGESNGSVTLTYNSASHAAITNPTKTNYTFEGWYSGDDGAGQQIINTSGVLQANKTDGVAFTGADGVWIHAGSAPTLHAKWSETPRTITTSSGEGGSVDAASYTAYVVTKTAISATPATGYKFLSWEVVSGSATFADQYSASTTMNATSDAEIKANFVYQWSIAGSWLYYPATVNWDADTYAMGNITKVSGDDVCSVEITLPANTNYTFQVVDRSSDSYTFLKNGNDKIYYMTYGNSTNWGFGTTSGYNYDCGITTAGAGTYTFTWNITDKQLTVTYPTSYYVTAATAGGGTVAPASATYMSTEVGGEITATPNYAYYFNGWTSNAGGSFTNASAATTTFKPASADATVTAAFAERTAFIEANFQVYNSDRSVRTKTGNSWSDNSTAIKMNYDAGNNRYYLHTYSTPAELKEQLNNADAYFYIKTSSSTSSIANDVSYHASGADALQSLSAYGSSNKKATSTVYTANSFKFTGSEDGYVIIYFDGSNVWYELECALSYYGGEGATGDAPAERTYYAYNSNQTAASNSYSKTGYTFDHWDTAADDSGSDYAAGATNVAMNAHEVCLHAMWTINNHDITYTAPSHGSYTIKAGDDASAVSENISNVDYNTTVTLAATPASGYSFSSWSLTGATAADASSANTTFSMPDNDVTVAASFTEDKHTVTVEIGSAGGGVFSYGGSSSLTTKDISGIGISTATGDIVVDSLNPAWRFKKWEYDGAKITITTGGYTSKTIRVNATADATITAVFEPRFGLIGSLNEDGDPAGGMPNKDGETWGDVRSEDYEAGFEVFSFTAVGTGEGTGVDLRCTRTLESNKQYKFQIVDRATVGRDRFCLAADGSMLLEANESITLNNKEQSNANVLINTIGYGEYTFRITNIAATTYNPTVTVDRPTDSKQLTLKCGYSIDAASSVTLSNDGGTAMGHTNEGGGGFDISDGGFFKSGSHITFTATPATGYVFEGWYTDNTYGTRFAIDNPMTMTERTNDNVTVYARFIEKTNTFTDGASTGYWNNTSNWSLGSLPTINERVVITKPVTVDIAHAVAKRIILDQSSPNTGSLTIQANKGLEVTGTIQVYNGSSYSATTPADLVLESSASGNATLIFDNSNSDQATVQMYSKGWTTGTQGSGTWNWQFVGVPVTDATRMNDYYGGYMYEWSGEWVDKTDMYGALTPFTAYSVSYPTGDAEHLHTYSIDGTLVPTGDKSISIPANTSVMAAANSWTAPIYINDIVFTNCTPATIYLYNTGYNPDAEHAATAGGERYAGGSYRAVPVNSAPYTGDSLIAPMQGFMVRNKTANNGSMNIDYNTVVRPAKNRDIVAGAMHAPQRQMEAEPTVMKIYVSDSLYDDRVVLLARNDFSRGFDNGWDGEKFQVNAVTTAPRLFAINETGGKEEVSAIPELENTVLGFRPGTEETYTIHFDYNGDETLYLRDTRTGSSTLITNESKYIFLSDGTNEDARFIISRIQSTPTGVEETGAGSKAYKLMIEDHIYIIRDGRMYSVDGALVNLDRK